MFATAFFLGLVSSLHCVGMCGPFVLMLPFSRSNPSRKVLQLLSYHAGRIASYAVLGLLFGLAGKGLYLAGLQQRLSLLLGLVMLGLVLLPFGWRALERSMLPAFGMLSGIRTKAVARLQKGSLPLFLVFGMLNGLLPCAMVYAALFGATAMADPVSGMLFMVAFGLGIVPLLSAVGYLDRFLQPSIRKRLRYAMPVATAVVAVLLILRGLGLGIAHLSPDNIALMVMSAPGCH